jgi:hypothetical protein
MRHGEATACVKGRVPHVLSFTQTGLTFDRNCYRRQTFQGRYRSLAQVRPSNRLVTDPSLKTS